MNRFKALIRSMFGFSRTETNAFLVLLPLMAMIIFSEPIYRYYVTHRAEDFSKEKLTLDNLVAQWDFQRNNDSISPLGKDKFKFDPNTATEEDLLNLGFPGNLAQRILNYRAKKGTFRITSDLKNIYGMDSVLYAELIPFIDLPEKKINIPKKEKEKIEFAKKLETPKFDLNLSDTTELIKIYGIGLVLANRIIGHRNKLGGFITSQQLTEIYGLDTMVINRLNKKSFISEHFIPTQLNINLADEKTLAAHPYIKYKLAKAFVTYRFQHGNFKAIADLTQIQTMKPETVEKLKPYISF